MIAKRMSGWSCKKYLALATADLFALHCPLSYGTSTPGCSSVVAGTVFTLQSAFRAVSRILSTCAWSASNTTPPFHQGTQRLRIVDSLLSPGSGPRMPRIFKRYFFLSTSSVHLSSSSLPAITKSSPSHASHDGKCSHSLCQSTNPASVNVLLCSFSQFLAA